MNDKKTETVRIRCSRETMIRFKRYAAPFQDYEQALDKLLNHAGETDLMEPVWRDYKKK